MTGALPSPAARRRLARVDLGPLLIALLAVGAGCSDDGPGPSTVAPPAGDAGGATPTGTPPTKTPPSTPPPPPPVAPPTADEIPEHYDRVRELLRRGRPDDAMTELRLIARAGATAREILSWARDDEDLLALRDRTDYQALMYPEGDRPAGQVPVSKLYALGGPARLTHAPDGPALELPGLGAPPTEGERWQPITTLSWSALESLLSATRALSSAGERRSYAPAPSNRDIDALPPAVRQGGVERLHQVGWWRPREGTWLLVVPYRLGGAHGGLGFAVYAPAPGGVQLVAASGEIPLPCEGRDALLLSDSREEVRVVAGCQGTSLTACRVRWEAGALRSTCGGMVDAPLGR